MSFIWQAGGDRLEVDPPTNSNSPTNPPLLFPLSTSLTFLPQQTTMAKQHQQQLVLLLTIACLLSLASAINTPSKVTNNPADQLVAVLNNNRTVHHLPALYDNPGLACIALQYIKAYQGNCDALGGPNAKKPEDSAFADTFAPNCDVETSSLAQITGRFLGCQSKYMKPDEAFSEILMKNGKSLDILYSKNHTEVGAAVSGSDGGGPYFWCMLFSNGKSNSSFTLEGGVAKILKPGCFSGANDDCSGGQGRFLPYHFWSSMVGIFAVIGFAFGLW